MHKCIAIDDVRRTIDLIDGESGKSNKLLELNRSEYNLFIAFCDSHGEMLDKQTLIEKGWPGRVVGDNSLAVAIMKLRKKLDSLQLGFEINNLPGEGYVFINANRIAVQHCSGSVQQEELAKQTVEKETFSHLDSNILEAETKQSLTYVRLLRLYNFIPITPSVLIGLLFVAIVFFSFYREAFECFECFGEFYG
ncbi:helix-turn-helix domain-containing protein [Vibrio sp. AND4]|uniref:winged helix-turn-helix domain-containing protein n=1 Tax=Vibrio sp. AND4 TaxID=314289 RepID=UPI00015EFB6F|nr:helix-turn-helix domain-containing protein [Vibrio sp. AND4]EDP60124.1 putative transcriptional regulator ToxR [Vibrio sp. AND4]